MTVIRPNSISGVTSITAQGDTLTLYKSDGTNIGQLDVNVYASSGVSTIANLNVIGGNVGIGSQNPEQRLDVAGTVQVKTGTPQIKLQTVGTTGEGRLYFGDDSTFQAGSITYNHQSDYMSFRGGGAGAERLRIDSSVRLLVGTQTEGEETADDLTIATSGHTGITIRSGTSQEGNIFFSDGTSGSDELRGSVRYYHSLDTLTFGSNGSGADLRIDSSGNVGINTISPGAKFHVYGNSASQVVTLTDGATITPDFSTGNNFTVTLGGNRTLANPTNTTVGQSGVIYIVQDGTGSRTLGVGTHWHFPAGTAPTLTTTGGSVDVFAFSVRSSTSVVANAILDVKVTA